MSSKKTDIEEIKLRKQKLQQEIDLIEDKYTRKAKKISGGVQNTLKPLQTIRDNPFKSLGISVAVGILIGASGRRKSEKRSDNESGATVTTSKNDGFTSLLMSELKRMAAKRAMMYISDLVDKKVMPGLTKEIKERSQEPSEE